MSTFKQKLKKSTYPTLKVWEEAERQLSAADILFDKVDSSEPMQNPQKSIPQANKNDAAYIMFNDIIPQKKAEEKKKEEIPPYPTLAVWHHTTQAQSKQENMVAKLHEAREQKNLIAQTQVNRAKQAENTKHVENPPLQVENMESSVRSEKSKPERGEVKKLPPLASAAFAAALGIKLPREWTLTTRALTGAITALYYNTDKGREELAGYLDETGKFMRELPKRKEESIREALAAGNYPAD